ncbi:leucyl/phenylalanyl-tRNA--protein transferase [Actinoplanes solisilvae]|uniref:leucyl/phenylalanyl-tRNA--protein transferase n=1 Tax=Actinoplanes solisilvae TaxID=2486853 RepID=UPI001F0C7B8D|nr:leucyl/phenylalanyl-tRNA--protein transferase [Actinoplanes solisilvae]
MPTPVRPRSAWQDLDLATAPADGPVAFGDDLGPRNLLDAYRCGLYPFPAATIEHRLLNELSYADDVSAGRIPVQAGSRDPYGVAWCSPDPRPVIATGRAHVPRSFRRQLRRSGWTTTVDFCFQQVVDRCREGRAEHWLTDELMASLTRLHVCGYAQSVEVWDGEDLIGGVFGMRIGAVFSADSQFTLSSGAGRVAVVELSRRFAEAGGVAVDVQRDSDHVRLLGAEPVARRRYLALLRTPHPPAPLPTGRRAVELLAD